MESTELMLLEPNLDEVLNEGVNRLKERSTWKLWTWPTQPTPHMEQREFVEAEAFRQHLVVRKQRVGVEGRGREERGGACGWRRRMWG
eukprot:1139200-Pelagomonas_calceolata.AAC.2